MNTKGLPANRNIRTMTLLLGTVLICLLWLVVWLQIESKREAAIAEAFRDNMNLTKAFEEQVRNLFTEADHDLIAIQKAFEKGGADNPVIAAELDHTRPVRTRTQVGIANAQGEFVVSLDARALGNNYSDREWFRLARDNAEDKLHIGATIVGRGTGQGSIPLSRRIKNPDGNFGGAVVLGLSTEYFRNFFNRLELGPDKLVGVLGMDGIVRILQTQETQQSGQDVRTRMLWQQIQISPSGSFIEHAGLDDVSYLTTYRVMPEYPLVLLLGVSVPSALGNFEQHKKDLIFGATWGSLLIIVICFLLTDISAKRKLLNLQREAESLRLRQTAKTQAVLREIAEATIVSTTQEDLFRSVQCSCAKLFSAPNFYIAFVDKAAGKITLQYYYDSIEPGRVIPQQRPWRNGLTEYLVRQGQIVHLSAKELEQLNETGEAQLVAFEAATEWMGAPLVDSNGKIFGVMAIFSRSTTPTFRKDDIEALAIIATQVSLAIERRQALELLKRSEERYRTVADYNYDWEYWLLPDGNLTYVSPSCERITGYHVDRFLQEPKLLDSIVHPDDQNIFDSHTCAANIPSDMELHEIEFRIYTLVGEERWISHFCRPVYSNDGEFLGRRASNRDITDRKRMEEELRHQATIDGLTGVFNRSHFLVQAAKELKRLERYDRDCAVLMLDIDHFKRTNDSYGHAVGDAALQRVAKICAETLRDSDLLGRMGGEEFAALLPETNAGEGAMVAERVRQSIQDTVLYTEDGRQFFLTVSIGVVENQPRTEMISNLLLRADVAMYQAKAEGRNRVEVQNGDKEKSWSRSS